MVNIQINAVAEINNNAISYQQAQELKAITDLREKLNKLKETARYLYGKKRGVWGRMTMADEKRSAKIDIISASYHYVVKRYNDKYNTQIN